MPIAKKKEIPYADPDDYWVKISDVKKTKTDYGPQNNIFFKILEGKFEGTVLPKWFPTEYSSKNMLGRLLKALGYDIEEEEEIDLDDIVGEELMITVEDKKTRTGVVSLVADFYKRKRGRKDEKGSRSLPG